MMEDIQIIPTTIYVGKRELVRLGKRWIIYLPVDYNDIWEKIKTEGRKVKVYLVVTTPN